MTNSSNKTIPIGKEKQKIFISHPNGPISNLPSPILFTYNKISNIITLVINVAQPSIFMLYIYVYEMTFIGVEEVAGDYWLLWHQHLQQLQRCNCVLI